jgi:ABC-type transport system substrate-binding protein
VRILTASYAKIGITIKAKGIDFKHYVRYVLAGKPQAYVAGWLADYPSMDNFLYLLFESSQSPYTDGTSYSNPKVDALLA